MSDLSSSPGLLDLLFLQFSLQTVEHNSPPPSGPKSVALLGFLCQLLPVFTLREIVSLNVSPDLSRQLSVLTWLAWTGSFTYLWFSLASGLFPRKTPGFLSLRLCLALLSPFLEGGKFPLSRFLQRIEQAVSGFTVPLPHHVSPAPPAPLPPALLTAKFVFVR